MSKQNKPRTQEHQHENGHHRKNKEDLLKEVLDEDEYSMVKAKRELDSFDKGSTGYKVLLQFDQLRRQRDQALWAIEQRLNDIENSLATVERCKAQINTGQITEELRPGVTMTERELNNYISKQLALAEANARDVINQLAPMLRIVGCRDAAGKTVLSSEGYSKIVEETEKKLNNMGYQLFDEDIRNDAKEQ